jgi:diguanylate cyclase (GGDEF)-like protein
VSRDISERKNYERALLHHVFLDDLTGLPNRVLFMDRLEVLMRRVARVEGYLYGVIFLDLDHFKMVNDSLGHMAGDELLVAVAKRLRESVRNVDTVSRLGGDEFAILLDGIDGRSDLAPILDRIQSKLKEPLVLGGQELFITASMGSVIGSQTGKEAEDVVHQADAAMYCAKARGRNCYEIFEQTMHSDLLPRLRLMTDLRRAVECEDFHVEYQPVVSLRTGEIWGVEALARWSRPEFGLVSPAEFIPLAEETGLIISLDRQILRQACRQCRDWTDQFPDHPPLKISVNFSGHQFRRSDLIAEIDQILADTGCDPENLVIEITERVLMDDPNAILRVISELKARNIQLYVDDFGTGYSSLSYLHRFPVDGLKIDRSFIGNMHSGGRGYQMVRAIVALAHSLDLHVIAEGLETPAQVARIRPLDCEYAQGYYFSKPMGPEGITAAIGNQIRALSNGSSGCVVGKQPEIPCLAGVPLSGSRPQPKNSFAQRTATPHDSACWSRARTALRTSAQLAAIGPRSIRLIPPPEFVLFPSR